MTDIILLDGSIGQELVKRSNDRITPMWSTQVLMDHPDLVYDVHSDYLSAGATIVTTNTYAIHRSRLVRIGMEDKQAELLGNALDQADRARARHKGKGRIAGSLGPLLASYRPDLEPDPEQAETLFGQIVEAMAPRVDLFLIETVSSIQEAEGALRGTTQTDKEVWIAFSVMDDDGTRLRSGENLADAAAVIARHRVDAVLINCTRPESVAPALDIIATFGKPFGAYANGFEVITDGFLKDAPTVDALQARSDLEPEVYARHAMSWVDQGATIIGGCCGVGPGHIAGIARQLKAAGHTLVLPPPSFFPQ
ncbi:MAG: homocysteine S-methyltransferase family protein [Arenibacterium sp.]